MTLTTVEAGAYLHHIHLNSPDPAALADFYSDTMDMPLREREGEMLICRGPRRLIAISQGPANRLAHCAFACRDAAGLASIRARAGAEGLNPRDFVSSLLQPGAFSVQDPDGNRVIFGLAVPGTGNGHGIPGPTQHLTLASQDIGAIERFYADKLGFAVSDRVVGDDGEVMTCFMRSNHEHHTLACFLHRGRTGIDHHSYEAGDFLSIRDWCDRFAERGIRLMWGPGRHGPGNNIFIFITDPDGNWIEVSAELEVILDRPVREWPHVEHTLNMWGRGLMRI